MRATNQTQPVSKCSTARLRRGTRALAFGLAALFVLPSLVEAQDIVSSQLRQGFGKNKVRYKDFNWHYVESEHLELYYEPEFEYLADQAVQILEEAYDHISEIMRHELSAKPPIIIFKSHYEFQQTNIIHSFLPPGVAGFAEPLRYRMVIPFDGDLDEFRNVLTHELMHIFQYDVVNRGPVKRMSNPIASPPTWIMEGMAEYATEGMNTVDEMVLRDAVLTDELLPLRLMDSSWDYLPNRFLAYKQSHSLMNYIADNYGPEKIGRILRVWDSQTGTDKLLERLIDLDMRTLYERWSAQMRKTYWPLLQSRDYLSELATPVVHSEDMQAVQMSPRWSISGDMLAVLSTDGVENHVDIIRLRNGSLIERVTDRMRTADFDDLTMGPGTVSWAPDGHTIAFVAKDGPEDVILLWDLYTKKLGSRFKFDGLEVIEALAWSPDSRRLAFAGTGFGQRDIYIADTSTGALTQVTGTPQRDDYPAWAPDGSGIAFSSKSHGQFDIKLYDLESRRTRTLVSSPTDDLWPIWLPEGNKIVFVSTRERINDLFVYHLEEDREYRLTRTISGVIDPTLSPDGSQIVLSTYYHGRRVIYRMDMPEWPEVKHQSEILAARARDAQPRSMTEADTSSTELVAQASPSALAAMAEDRVAEVVEKLNPAVTRGRSANAVKLAQASQPFDQFEEPSAAAASTADRVIDAIATDSTPSVTGPKGDEDLELISSLPRRRYTPELEFDGMSVQMGYYNGFLSGIAQLSMSDLLGNHSLSMFTDYIGSNEVNNDLTFAAAYTYYGQRPTYNVMLFNWNQYFNDRQTYPTNRGRAPGLLRSKQAGLLFDVAYPLDVYRRIELSYSFVDEQRELAWPFVEQREGFTTHLFKAAYVHDSLSNGLLGATAGRRYYLSVGRTAEFSNTDRSLSHLEADYRHYFRLGRWSVFGLRTVGIGSLGQDGLEYNLGGPAWFIPFSPGFNLNVGPLRGFEFSEFSGSRVLLVNSEIRVPFIRNIVFGWPGTFAIPAVDGSFFLDIGTAWNDGDELDLSLHNPDEPFGPDTPKKLHAGYGFGMLVYFLAPLNFEFARQTDFQGSSSDWNMHFSFGKSF